MFSKNRHFWAGHNYKNKVLFRHFSTQKHHFDSKATLTDRGVVSECFH